MMDCTIEMDLLLKYPLILSLDDCNYQGFIEIKNKTYQVSLTVSEGNAIKFQLEMNDALRAFEMQIRNLSERTDLNVVGYLDELMAIISMGQSDAKGDRAKFDTQTWQKVLNEYYEFRQFHINVHKATLSNDLRLITIEHRDSKNRTHGITVGVNYEDDGGKLFKIIDCDLPDSGGPLQSQSEETLAGLYEKFLAKIECPRLQSVFDMLDEIDGNCWVLDPEKPSRGDLHRRIMLDDNVSAVVAFNACDLPQIKFLGPQHAVRRYAAALSENVDDWDANENVLQGLLRLFGMSEFPARPPDVGTDELLVNEGECCVCFSMRLNGRMPEIVCSNRSCSKCFHAECLYQSLCLSNPRKLGSETIGQCPNCEKTIHCSAVTMKQSRLL